MIHTILYHGRFTPNFERLKGSSGKFKYLSTDGEVLCSVESPSEKVNGIVFGYMEKSKIAGDDKRGFFAVKVDNIVLKHPLELKPSKHTDDKGYGPGGGSLFGDESAQQLLRDIIAINPQLESDLMSIYEKTFGKLSERWLSEIKNWVHRSRNIKNELAEDYVKFFTRVFENTNYPGRAWFGIHNSTASLVVGGIFLASVIKSGKDKGIWLLLENTPDIEGWRSWETRSTKSSAKPLKWFHTQSLEKVTDLLDNPDLWQSYHIASTRIHEFPIVASDRDARQKKRGKQRLSTIYISTRIFNPPNPLDEIEKHRISYGDLQETERKAIVQSRIGQGKFRTELIQYWGCCAVTGCRAVEILRASHIKPWSKASNKERLDPYNGLLLIPNLDVAFDNGLISFTDDGNILISALLSKKDQIRLGIQPDLKIAKLDKRHRRYLQYHREQVFRDPKNVNE